VERLPDLASELVQLKPDVIFAYGGDVAPHAKCKAGWLPASAAPVELSRELPDI
jgi:hypothetical protein